MFLISGISFLDSPEGNKEVLIKLINTIFLKTTPVIFLATNY